MSIEISDVSATRKQCVIVYPSDEFLKDYQQKVRSFRGQLPGFRPGKVPQNVVEKRCGYAFRQELLDERMRKAWEQIFKSNYEPIGSPEVVITPDDALSQPVNQQADVTLTIKFDVHPTVTPLEIASMGLEIDPIAAPTKEEVSNYLSFIAREHAQESDKEGVSELGDVVYVDIFYKKDNKTENDLRLVLHADEIHPAFVEKLQSVKAGDELEFEYTPVNYDKNHHDHKHDENCQHDHHDHDATLDVKVTVKKVAKLDPASDEVIYKKLTNKDDFSKEKFDSLVQDVLKKTSEKKHFIANEEKVLDHLFSLHTIEIPQAQYAGKNFANEQEKQEFEKTIRCEYILNSYRQKMGVQLSEDLLNFFGDIFCEESKIPPALFSYFTRMDKKFRDEFVYMANQRAVVKTIIDSLTPDSAAPASKDKAIAPAKAEKKSSSKKSKAAEEKVKDAQSE